MSQSFVTLAPLSALVVALSGCSLSVHPVVREPAVSVEVHKESHGGEHLAEAPPVRVEYEIRRADAQRTILLAGQSEVDLGHSAMVERAGPHDGSSMLRLAAQRTFDGKLLVDVDYDERSNEGQKIHWKPTLSLATSSVALAKLDLGGGDGRVLVVKIVPLEDAPAKPAAQVVSRLP